MPDPHQHPPMFTPGTDEEHDSPTYRIMRRGSYYNILGPSGRVFSKYRSASVVGPRWEELTETPWPHSTSTYESGHRLWELGLIPREDIGKTELVVRAPEPQQPEAQQPEVPTVGAQEPARAEPAPKAMPKAARKTTRKAARQTAEKTTRQTKKRQSAPRAVETAPAAEKKAAAPARKPAPKKVVVVKLLTTLALPAPRIDLAIQNRLMAALRRDPALIFQPPVKQALQYEVEYHRPQARWAQHLLELLARYERRERVQQRTHVHHGHSPLVMEKHLAWQEQRLAGRDAEV